MQDYDTDVIAVMNKGVFMGLVYKDDLIVYLLKNNQDKDKQIHTIAHDLKNPISAIEGMVELIKMEQNETLRIKYLNYILQACSDSNNIISNLLELASLEYEISKHLENVDINSLLNEFLTSPFYSAKRKNIRISNNIDDEQWYVNINPKHFKRAIQNLIVNSIKFSNPGNEITLSTYLNDDRVIIKISDEGIGIPSHLQSEIFKKFSKARRKGTQGEQSTGLGMAIVKEIVEFHNGKIWLWSEEGKGTEVYISLPLIPVIDHSTTLSKI
jgi:signal transduction histidine kinase